MTNPVQIGDIIDRFPGTMTDVQFGQCQALLDDGWEQILARVPGVQTRLDAGSLRPGIVIAVLRQAIIPVLQNPGGYLEQSIDNWTGRRDSATSTGKLMLSDDDLAPLQGFDAQSQAFEIAPC